MHTLILLPYLLPAALAIVITPTSRDALGSTQSVQQAFVQAGIVPDVLPSFNPVLQLGVTYTISTTGETKSVSPGKNLTIADVINIPMWSTPSITANLTNETFVVAMVDPDAPTPQDPTVSQIRHFVGGGYTLAAPPCGKGEGMALVSNTPSLGIGYFPPAPPNTSDAHRYVFLLYRQPLDFAPTNITSDIESFNITTFASQYGLGDPIAGNFMRVSANPNDLIDF